VLMELKQAVFPTTVTSVSCVHRRCVTVIRPLGRGTNPSRLLIISGW
jgi:hypothetical protein